MKDNNYMRVYLLTRYHTRRKKAKEFLGGKCKKCGTEKDLQFDHINRKEKNFTISKLWSISEKRFWEEVKKCQLLCVTCHRQKTLKDMGWSDGHNTHGTLTSYRYCKCQLCKKAKSEWNKKKYMENLILKGKQRKA